MNKKCELCHNEEAEVNVWLNADQTEIKVTGTYRIGEKCLNRLFPMNNCYFRR